MISMVFWTEGRKFAFQRVGDYWRLYDAAGDFVREFRNFWAMCKYIKEGNGNED